MDVSENSLFRAVQRDDITLMTDILQIRQMMDIPQHHGIINLGRQ